MGRRSRGSGLLTVDSRITSNEADFESILERYAALLRSIIARQCPRNLGVDVTDIEQEAKVRLWRALQREKKLDEPASYIYRIAVSATIDAVRRVIARREDQLRTGDADDEEGSISPLPVKDSRPSPEEHAEQGETMAKIAAAIASLPEGRRRAVELHLQGLTVSEIAELLLWSEGKARNLIYRGMDDLREALRREGIVYE